MAAWLSVAEFAFHAAVAAAILTLLCRGRTEQTKLGAQIDGLLKKVDGLLDQAAALRGERKFRVVRSEQASDG